MTSTTQALPLGNGISSQLAKLIAIYLGTQDAWIPQIVNNMSLDYKKLDSTINQFPSVSSTKVQNNKKSLGGYETGEITLELKLPLPNVRGDLQQYAEQWVGLLEIINLRGSITNYCRQNMFGLWWVGKKFTSSFKNLYRASSKAQEAIIEITLDYKVDFLAYIEGLEANGYSLFSPDAVVYGLAEDLSINNKIIGDSENAKLCTKSVDNFTDCTTDCTIRSGENSLVDGAEIN